MADELKEQYKKTGIIHLVITLAGLALNFAILTIVNKLGIPLYLDTLGSIIVAWECGPIFGVATALFSLVIYGVFFNEMAVYFSLVGILTVIVAYFMMKAGFLKKIHTTILFAIILGMLSGIVSGIIQIGLGMGGVDYFIEAIRNNMIDKIIVTIAVVVITRLFPEDIRRQIWKLDLCYDIDNNRYTYENTMEERSRVKSHRRLMMVLTIEAVALAGVVAWAGVSIYLGGSYISYSKMVQGTSEYVASMIDGDMIDEYLEQGTEAPGYTEMLDTLRDIQKYSMNLEYLYVYKITEDGIYLVFDTDSDFLSETFIGDQLEFEKAFEPYREQLLAGENIGIVESKDRYGWLLTDLEPVYDSDGNCVAYVGADVSMTTIRIYAYGFAFRIAVIALSFLIFSLAFGFWVSDRHFNMSEWFYNKAREAKKDADRANETKTRFIANVSHELRTPINTIMGMSEMIQRENPDDNKDYVHTVREYSKNIENASDLMMGIVSDILDISKIESGNMDIVEREYNVRDNLQSVISMMKVRSNEKGLLFEQVIDENIPSVLYGDSVRIRQVLLNLLSNAVKYTDKGGLILKAESEIKDENTCHIIFSVKDTGMGIKQDDLEKIFLPFLRFAGDDNNTIQGTGLGLSLAKQFAEKMGGVIECDSRYGEGSVFSFIIDQKIIDPTPIGVFSTPKDKEEKQPEPEFVASNGKILVIDDSEMILELMKNLLSDGKLKVFTAESGEKGLLMLEEEKYDLVLLDHMMPGMDGIETLAHIREKNPDIPVIALTGNENGDGGRFYKEKGFNDYLLKPVRMKELVETIHKYI